MEHPEQIDDETLEKCRAYLRLLASSQVDSWLRQRLDASDLVQQTMLDAVARRDQFCGSSEAELLAWLRTILSNNLVDAIRHYGRAKRMAIRQERICFPDLPIRPGDAGGPGSARWRNGFRRPT